MRQSGGDMIQSTILQRVCQSSSDTKTTLFQLIALKLAWKRSIFGKIDAYLPFWWIYESNGHYIYS